MVSREMSMSDQIESRLGGDPFYPQPLSYSDLFGLQTH